MKKSALFFSLFSLLIHLFLPLAQAETIQINATVPAAPSDFSADIEVLTPRDPLPQNTIQTNEITATYLATLTSSVRFYHLLAATTLLTLSIMTLLSFFSRTRLTPGNLPLFILSHLGKRQKKGSLVLSGKIIDPDTERAVRGANIYLLAEGSERIIAHTVSNLRGYYAFSAVPEGVYCIQVLKTNYLPFTIHKRLFQDDMTLNLALSRKEQPLHLLRKAGRLFENMLSFSFEILLILSFVLLTIIGMSIGWEKIVGFLVIAIFNLTIWSLHRRSVAQN